MRRLAIVYWGMVSKVIVGAKGVRYQLIKDGVAVSGLQVVGGVIENRYTSENHRKNGYSNKLISAVKNMLWI